MTRHPDLTVYDPTSVLCDSQRNVCPMTMNGKYLYSYGDHMSDYANGLVAERFLPLVRR
ncbi:SGNH hydrolase domain-containing protein [Paraburkholderia sp. BL21I4N1]|uniref:SGNH hydrolase domain-containing protein n=1 Tax=Paraburkholderia sp. BL21I4N1 TaxID=1938801 RepID=UPI002157E999|nr:SGNH hydrolase domain-containing protein [Paraburkholderia sp. BL21I4N1]